MQLGEVYHSGNGPHCGLFPNRTVVCSGLFELRGIRSLLVYLWAWSWRCRHIYGIRMSQAHTKPLVAAQRNPTKTPLLSALSSGRLRPT
ncbi:Short-chain dehydrogenase/reductase tropE [Fusarium oxysporum f. sp. albedinis]|nr:Short-chain dehydrogenase/reductase tropE [Fusarium oxysporum f. sp. albedinis]